jgi:NADPH:quinone reductase-like Zn-dependent oxidoreductase
MNMKAAVWTNYGPPEVLQIDEIAKPVQKKDEILVRIHSTTVNVGDVWARDFKKFTPRSFSMPGFLWLPTRFFFGLTRPKLKVLGSEFAGTVEAVGVDVSRFAPGDRVFGYRGASMGANAEYLSVPADSAVAAMPAGLTFEEAAGIPYGALMALGLLRKTGLKPGQKILINGASGGIGSAAVQLAKRQFGAEVTGVCSTSKMEYVRSLGADHVVDYTREDFTQRGERYDVVLDILGVAAFAQVKAALTETGRFVLASFKTRHLLQMLRTTRSRGKKVICAMASESADDLQTVRELVEAGVIKTFTDKRYPLDQAAEAHRYVESGGKRGSVVITIKEQS